MLLVIIFQIILFNFNLCDCNFVTNIDDALATSDVIFESKLKENREIFGYTAKPNREFKGLNLSSYQISRNGLDCSYFKFDTTNTFLIYGSFNSDSTIHVSFCSRTSISSLSYDYDFLESKETDFKLGLLAKKTIMEKTQLSKMELANIKTIVGYDWIHKELDYEYDTENPKREKVQEVSQKMFYHIHPFLLNVQSMFFSNEELSNLNNKERQNVKDGILILSIYDQTISRSEILNYFKEKK